MRVESSDKTTKKEKERKIKRFLGKNVSEIFLNSWGVSWNFFFTRRKKKLKEKKKKNTPGKIIPWFHTK